jgi:hypothetical protein
MEVDDLRRALSMDDADPGAVLARLTVKRHARQRRRLAIAAGCAAAIAAAGGVLLLTRNGSSPSTPPQAQSPVAQLPAEGCIDLPLADRLAGLRGSGASVIVGRGTLTGRTARDGVRHHEMTLTDIRTLSGPPVADGTTVWVATPELPPLPDPVARADAGPLWGPGGTIFALVLPQQLTHSTLGVTVDQAPVVGDQVVFGRSGGCWSTADLPGKPYHGPLTEIPGSGSYARATAAGLTAVPLGTVERLATGK